ncbi:BEL1-like homeodomain protein 7 [Platanthera guangdongensis]|uniref:BEL1-like homeodomain protein 7 n=1 Tax=Platanthera guangdongensis TaxID=2320717 RepID=A0ABR2LWG9_9ASPA
MSTSKAPPGLLAGSTLGPIESPPTIRFGPSRPSSICSPRLDRVDFLIVTECVFGKTPLDRRYKQYYDEMQIIVSSFDAIAGSGAAKPYTALALETISRHFRCLRDVIGSQIRSTQKTLGEQDGSSGKGSGISRLRFIDQQIRKQRAIQQLSVMPQQAWRPQRGLPENSVSVLRGWLFEHFLNPYFSKTTFHISHHLEKYSVILIAWFVIFCEQLSK